MGITMKLGAFSVSLNVADLAKSKAFYEALGFSDFGGVADQGWLILKNGETVIGLFSGMFEANAMTFNPGWDQNAQNVEGDFDDVRTIQKQLKEAGIALSQECDESTEGPAHIALTDPDGNVILIDQHR